VVQIYRYYVSGCGLFPFVQPARAAVAPSFSGLSRQIDRILAPRHPAKLEDGQQKAEQGQREADHNERYVIH
jgi:hypothetical protein